MDLPFCRAQLAASADAIRTLVQGLSHEHAHWKPSSEAWSIVEVMCHLVDEEREDFRTRLTFLLHDPAQPWPPIDPAGWAVDRAYQSRDLASALADFLAERQHSLDMLARLNTPDWQATYAHPARPLTAGDLLTSWAGHDLLHLRQIIHLHWTFLQDRLAPSTTDYAGSW